MRYLVTGTGGFVMSVFIERLLRDDPDATVTGVDLHSTDAVLEGHFREVRDRLRLATVDVRDAPAVRDLVRSVSPDVVVHGATVTHDPVSERENPGRFLDVNVLGTAHLLEAARDARRFILVSSAAVYGDSPERVVTEETPPSPDEMYGISKWAAERAALRYSELFDLPLSIVRLTKMFGPMERPTLGRRAMSLPYHLAAALVGGRKLTVTERTMRATGDWLSATEAAEALRLLVDVSGVYNVASGVRTTVPELVSLFGEDVVEVAEAAAFDMAPDEDHGKNAVVSPERVAEAGWRCGPLPAQVANYVEWAERNRDFFTA
ncbi:SDR family NAD(P)-dependent oxidoreductase [Amycolatopsis endophytica]|uniref:Nucleoside-diphosphate-sugar epimerase n=1 Tax=Amycolatopsis endophytica TaxID=860233 RepID=A0A853B2Q7_9PSEU|nr:NAD(P)-dependent oxidoreductase [Amycolatopsis endophytica]NYI89097.1 nucleoside-diphosphate-sugar epimerase [Amycolatopsis endophytica]